MVLTNKQPRMYHKKVKVPCRVCGRTFKGVHGVIQHIHAKHRDVANGLPPDLLHSSYNSEELGRMHEDPANYQEVITEITSMVNDAITAETFIRIK